MRSKRKKGGLAILAVAVLAIGIMGAPGPQVPVGPDTSRLVSVQHLPEGEVCPWDDSSQADTTELQFNNGLYIDPKTSEIYSVESDTGDKMVVFPNTADGNVAPKRMLHSPHRVYNIAADETKSELYVTVEFPPEVIVYNKSAFGEEQPLRRIRGDKTGLDAPHGVAVDEKNRLLFVNTWGHASNFKIKGTGAFYPPSIKVY